MAFCSRRGDHRVDSNGRVVDICRQAKNFAEAIWRCSRLMVEQAVAISGERPNIRTS